MNFMYFLSIVFLLLAFLLLKKTDKRLSLISELIYASCLFICLNTFVVYLLSFFIIKGSLLIYGLVNFCIALIILLVVLKNKTIQKYEFDKYETAVIFIFLIIVSLVVYFRNDGLSTIRYDSTDSAVHYQTARHFNNEMTLLDETNSKDIVYNYFNYSHMPIHYINAGLFIRGIPKLDSWKAFMFVDGCFYILCSLLFIITLLEILKKKSRTDALYVLCLALIYSLGFLLNSYMCGFCYLTLSMMTINLLFLIVTKFNNSWNEAITLKIILLFIVCFSVFFSYYLFIPSIYLALGLYYVWLYGKKEITFCQLLMYGGVTLVIPFILGSLYVIYPMFVVDGTNFIKVFSSLGYCYKDIISVIFVIVVFWLLIFCKKHNILFDKYLSLNLCITGIYILVLFLLLLINGGDIYYLFKIIYMYSVFEIVFFGKVFNKYKMIFFISCFFIVLHSLIIIMVPNSSFVNSSYKLDIYAFNSKNFNNSYIYFSNKEIDVIKESIKYKDFCVYNDEFPMIANFAKNLTFYSMTGFVPIIRTNVDGDYLNARVLLDLEMVDFDKWENLEDYPCLIYFNEVGKLEYEETKYSILFENEAGLILKKK